MNLPPAPLSMSANVSTVSFSFAHFIEMGTDNEFNFMVTNFTEKTSNTGEFDVDVALHFKNPLFQLPDKTLLSHLRS